MGRKCARWLVTFSRRMGLTGDDPLPRPRLGGAGRVRPVLQVEAEKAVSEATTTAAQLCRCGRPLGHVGRHLNGLSPIKNSQAPGGAAASPTNRNHKLRLMIEAEIKATQENIGKLKATIRVNQGFLTAEQAKLPALLQCVEALDNKRLPAPGVNASTHHMQAIGPAPSAPIFQTTATVRQPLHPTAETGVADTDGAILADYGVVLKFSMIRGLKFESWDDLPSINRKREDLNMPTFKRQMSRVR